MKIEEYKKEFESMTYEELREIHSVLSAIKKAKYRTSETRKQAKYQNNKNYRENNREKVKEQQRAAWKKYKEKNKEKIRQQNVEYQRKRRKKMKHEKVISLLGKMATKHANTSCVFDVSQLWNTYELDNR